MSEAIIIKAPNSSGIPMGCIVMWSGAVNNIPSGWALCNGSNGTPDLRNRFIVGAGSTYAVGATGGSDTVALTTAHLPAHTHGVGTLKATAADANTSRVTLSTSWSSFDSGPHRGYLVSEKSSTSHKHTITLSGATGSSGSGGAHENRPPYYALCFIMYIG